MGFHVLRYLFLKVMINDKLELPLSMEVERLRKVINDYKEYDEKRKKIMRQMEQSIIRLKEEISVLKDGVEGQKVKEIIGEYKAENHKLKDRIRHLEDVIEKSGYLEGLEGGIKRINKLYMFDKKLRLLTSERDNVIRELSVARETIKKLEDENKA